MVEVRAFIVRPIIHCGLTEPDNIEILSKAIGMDLKVIGNEEKVGSFSADILCKDINTNRNVVIENQLEQTDHTHLGQVITYCAGLEASTFIWISSQVREEHRVAVDWLNAITSDDYQQIVQLMPTDYIVPRFTYCSFLVTFIWNRRCHSMLS